MEPYAEKKFNKHVLVLKQKDRNNRLIASVFYDYVPPQQN